MHRPTARLLTVLELLQARKMTGGGDLREGAYTKLDRGYAPLRRLL